MVVHPRADLRLCLNAELPCLYAMAKKIKFSPVLSMLSHWQRMVTTKCTIDITSLVTRIATYVGALANAEVTYLPLTQEYQTQIGLDHFVQGHLMQEGPNHTLFMCYPGTRKRLSFLAQTSDSTR
jgi:hypothetical protein